MNYAARAVVVPRNEIILRYLGKEMEAGLELEGPEGGWFGFVISPVPKCEGPGALCLLFPFPQVRGTGGTRPGLFIEVLLDDEDVHAPRGQRNGEREGLGAKG